MNLPPPRGRWITAVALASALFAAGCIHAYWKTEAIAIARPGETVGPVQVTTPLKAHLADGSTVLFRNGGTIGHTSVDGDGVSFPFRPTLGTSGSTVRRSVPFDSIVGLETFEGKLLVGQTVVVSTATTALAAVAVIGLAKALFGSCPTVYADTGTGPVLEAEGFSYSIAPLLESRDIDPLRVRAGRDGRVRLELRNEALETHYINNIELVAVTHAPGQRAVPDQDGMLVLVDSLRPLAGARDRAGRDLRAPLSAPDGQLFASSPATLRNAREGDLDDWIDIDARDLPPGDSVAVVLRLRNSLLNTVLLYDGILGGRDAPNWMATGLQRISTTIDLSKWYLRTMGMRVTVDGVPLHSGDMPWTARLGDIGPIAFRDVAIVLPRPVRDARSVRVRMRFVADNWRIDYAGVAASFSRPASRMVPLSRVIVAHAENGGATSDDTAAVSALRESDGRYLETLPGQRMMLEFAPHAAAPEGKTTTYLIVWQGWYREWIRGSWLAEPVRTTAWTPGDAAVVTALRRWETKQPEMERAFYSSRIPVQ